MRIRAGLAAATAAAAVLAVALAVPAGAQSRRIKRLPERWQEWYEDVRFLITKEETRAFLELEKDYQREAFARRFWAARDPDPTTPDNPFKERYLERLAESRELFPFDNDERRRIYALNGEPGDIYETICGDLTWPLAVWHYGYSAHTGGSFKAIFYQPFGAGGYKIWRPAEGYFVLLPRQPSVSSGRDEERARFFDLMLDYCLEYSEDVEALLRDFIELEREGILGVVRAESAPAVLDPEWLQSFRAFSTDAAPDAQPLEAELEVGFPGPYQQRVIVAATLTVQPESAVKASAAGVESYHFLLNGEVLREDELFESFRYRFDLPVHSAGAPGAAGAADAAAPLTLVFERYLRPGAYQLVVKVEDVHGAGVFREEREIEVPHVAPEDRIVAGGGGPGETATTEVAGEPAELSVELLAEAREMQSGMARFAAVVTGGEPAKVSFYLDDKPVLTKRRPPYSVELNLGTLPVTHTVRVKVLGPDDEELATDEILVNPGRHAFVARLVEPEPGARYDGSLRARVEVEAPEGELVERVEIFLNETRVATLYQPPYVQPIRLESDAAAYVRAVAYLEDGNATEDLVLFNTGQFLEDVRVRLVELYATVRDRDGRPLHDLASDDFTVFEDGAEQEILRFERVDNLPIYLAMLVDTSASMTNLLPEVRRVALDFVERGLEDRDRAAVITFDDQPRLAAEFTGETAILAGALGGLVAGRGTALWDSTQFGLYYFKGIKGQKALLILSDGQDRRSQADFDEVVRFAQTAGVTVYSLVMGDKRSGTGAHRMTQLAEETGGQAFIVRAASDLAGIYEAIGHDLRSRYLVVYQAPPGDGKSFRVVDLEVDRPGAEVRTLRGYLP